MEEEATVTWNMKAKNEQLLRNKKIPQTNENTAYQNLIRCSKRSSKKKVHRYKGLPQEIKRSQSNFIPQENYKRTYKAKNQQVNVNNKDQSKINEIDFKETPEETN